MLQNALPSVVRRVMKFLSWGLAAFYYGLVFVYCVGLWPKLMMQDTPMLKIPMAFVYLGMMVGLVMMALYYAFFAVQCLLDKGKEEEKK
jgi:TRAP-type C4-dicarboxylate transport system permease small subunit